VIQVHTVTKRFDALVALDKVSLSLQPGVVLGVLGPNGAGKTTLFRLIAGFLQPDAGRVFPTAQDWPQIGYKPERLLFPNRMRVRDYLETAAALSGLSGARQSQQVAEALEAVDLTSAAGKRIAECSKGMRQRLAIAQALLGRPALLLLDEPSNGLDPEGQEYVCRLIQRLHRDGRTIMLASHQLHEVTQVCTDLVILKQGTVHYQNRMAEALAEHPHAAITVDRPLADMARLLESLDEGVSAGDHTVVLSDQALRLRRQVLSVLLGAGFDIIEVEQRRATLSEIYSEAIQ
jgi:ABC-2 type transport system ATP-binding protein